MRKATKSNMLYRRSANNPRFPSAYDLLQRPARRAIFAECPGVPSLPSAMTWTLDKHLRMKS
jgi:hypothetical protein